MKILIVGPCHPHRTQPEEVPTFAPATQVGTLPPFPVDEVAPSPSCEVAPYQGEIARAQGAGSWGAGSPREDVAS